MSISVGAVGTASTVVTPENTAAAVGSGALPVFATPYMIALMENAACNAIADGLEEGQSSVGTKLDVSHDAATPVGMHVTAKAELVEVDRRRLVFRVTAEDDAGPIGQGTHAFSSWRTSSSPRRRPRRAEARPTPKWPAMRSWKKIHKMSLSFCRKTGYTVVNRSGATRSGKPERSGVL